MDDLTLRYYDAEMRYLLEAGKKSLPALILSRRQCSISTKRALATPLSSACLKVLPS
ncbi:type VI secretion system baseplate subunit TssF [Klebsiella pneumoniae subsp. pneumoniae]|nr:type VI secretion system baseplate subunit TssF [Klebsiella pneumoniae subsp. pneumoniae]